MPRIQYSAPAILAFLISTFIATTAPPPSASAVSFDPGNIITDAVMGNYNSMSETAIRNFLRSQCNRSTCLVNQNIGGESAAHIIYRAAQDFHINPQALIVLLQKEQSLITANATATRLRKATGYGCPDTAACNSKYYGFKNQVRLAANLFRTVLNGGWSNYPVGWRYVQYHPNRGCGGSNVYIANRATSALYRYTPYQPNGALMNGRADSCSSYGNYNFYNYFVKWFGSTGAVTKVSARQVIPEMNSAFLPSGTFAIKATSGKTLAFVSESNANGAQAQIVNYHGRESQQFKLLKDGKYYKIRHVASGRFLDVSGAGTADGTKVQLWDENSTCAQKWAVEIRGDHYTFRSACSGKALDINGANIHSSGVHVQIWDDNKTVAQQWDLIDLSSAPVKNGEYNLKTPANTVLSLNQEYFNNGTPMKTGLGTAARTQLFQLNRRADGYYAIKNPSSGRYLDVSGASVASGTQVQLWDGNNTCAQRWVVKSNGDGYRLVNACSGKSLDVSGADIWSENTKIQIWDNNDSVAQRWYFTSRPTTQYLTNGTYAIESRSQSPYVIAPWQYTSPRDGLNALLWHNREVARTHNGSQNFTISYDNYNGYYTLYNTYTRRSLDVSGAGRNHNTNVQFWSNNASCAQRWYIIPTNNDYYKILSACSRLALARTDSQVAQGDNILIRNLANTDRQEWRFLRR